MHPLLFISTATIPGHTTFISCLDYCHSLLAGPISSLLLPPIQLVVTQQVTLVVRSDHCTGLYCKSLALNSQVPNWHPHPCFPSYSSFVHCNPTVLAFELHKLNQSLSLSLSLLDDQIKNKYVHIFSPCLKSSSARLPSIWHNFLRKTFPDTISHTKLVRITLNHSTFPSFLKLLTQFVMIYLTSIFWMPVFLLDSKFHEIREHVCIPANTCCMIKSNINILISI